MRKILINIYVFYFGKKDDNSLVFIDVTSNEAGLYICSVLKNSSSDEQPSYQPHIQAQIKVKTRPGNLY
jgi:hypothetical protein